MDASTPFETSRASGERLYKQRCAGCHDSGMDRTPTRQEIGQRWPDQVVTTLKTGVMKPMAVGLSDSDMADIATYVTGARPGAGARPGQAEPPKCTASTRFDPRGSSWNGWGRDVRNHRYQTEGGLKAKDVPRLKVKWAFTYIGARYSQPSIVGGRLFMASASGKVYAFDAKTGCHHWRFDAPAGVRTTVVVGAHPGAPSGYAAYFGDYGQNYYAVDAGAGTLLWKQNVETHPRGVLTGSPLLHKGRLIVPTSSWEEVTGHTAPYQCCTARGAIVSLDASSGKVLWKTYMIEQEPRPTRKNAAGTQMFGPAGAAVWSTPTIDPRRNLIYVATGNSYTEVKETSSDAIIALDFETGVVRWKNQVTPEDNFIGGCRREPRGVNCPLGEDGPDHDFGAAPILIKLPSGRDILTAGQKSGTVYGLDPDRNGRIVWRNAVGVGGALGGIEFGMATDGKTLFVANADTLEDADKRRPGLYALDPATGKTLWATPSPKVPCGWTGGTRCINANSAAPAMIPGAVFSGTIDGHMRAYAPDTGKVLWTFNTAGQTYQTINGVKNQRGGAIDAGGGVVADGMLFLMSGYVANLGGYPDNVLLAFSVDGR